MCDALLRSYCCAFRHGWLKLVLVFKIIDIPIIARKAFYGINVTRDQAADPTGHMFRYMDINSSQ